MHRAHRFNYSFDIHRLFVGPESRSQISMILLQHIDKVAKRELTRLEGFFTVVFVVEIVKDARVFNVVKYCLKFP